MSRAVANNAGAKETLAASWPGSPASGVGEESFTSALISELKVQAKKRSVLDRRWITWTAAPGRSSVDVLTSVRAITAQLQIQRSLDPVSEFQPDAKRK